MSCVTRTRCSWVSSQKVSKRSVSESTGPQDRVKDWRELPLVATGMVVEVGETRTGQCLPEDHPGSHTELDTHKARPRPRAHDQSHMAPQGAGHQVCPA